jgi:hypothetical protein
MNKALSNTQNLGQQPKDVLLTLRTGSYQGADPLDAVDALGTPVAMIADAVESMRSVTAIGEEITLRMGRPKRKEWKSCLDSSLPSCSSCPLREKCLPRWQV